MRLTLWLLGTEVLALELGPTYGDEADETYTDAGTTGHYPISFVASHDVPEDVACTQRIPTWDEDE